MGRSVSTPSNHGLDFYTTFTCDDSDTYDSPEDSYLEWEFFVEDITTTLREKYPSLEPADRWEGRECHVFLENRLVFITISEYCGLVALSVRVQPTTDYPGLAEHWMECISNPFTRPLALIARASNGEAFYQEF